MRKVSIALLGLACALAALAPAAADETAAGPVSFMIFGDPAEKAAYDGLVAAFEAKQPADRRQPDPRPRPERLSQAAGRRLRRRHAGRHRPDQLPALRRASPPRACSSRWRPISPRAR